MSVRTQEEIKQQEAVAARARAARAKEERGAMLDYRARAVHALARFASVQGDPFPYGAHWEVNHATYGVFRRNLDYHWMSHEIDAHGSPELRILGFPVLATETRSHRQLVFVVEA